MHLHTVHKHLTYYVCYRTEAAVQNKKQVYKHNVNKLVNKMVWQLQCTCLIKITIVVKIQHLINSAQNELIQQSTFYLITTKSVEAQYFNSTTRAVHSSYAPHEKCLPFRKDDSF